MSDYTEHIIRAQQYQIILDKEEEAYQVQSQISVLQESQINTLLETILNRYSNRDCIYQFDKIELDLGVISKANYENQLVFRVEEELVKFFNANIRENGTLRSGKMIVLNDRKLEQFEYFILNGYFNWDSSSLQSPSILLKELIVENSSGLVEVLNQHGKKEPVRKRLVFQFDEESLESIVSVVAKTESNYIISYKRNMLEQQRDHHFIDAEFTTFRNAVWEIILAYLFVESNSYYNKKSFLQYLIKKVAEKYNLTYKLLLEIIAKGVIIEQKASSRLEFKKIILELKTEQEEEASKQEKIAVKKVTVKEWIVQLEYYLKYGTFKSTFPYTSKIGFNHQFEIILYARDQELIRFLKDSLINPVKKDRLLQITNDNLLNQLVTIISIPFIKTSLDFFETISKNRSVLSHGTRALFSQIEEKKGRLILSSFTKGTYTLTDILPALLNNLQHEFRLKDRLVLNLFSEIRQEIPVKYQKIVEEFLMTFSAREVYKKQEIIDEKLLEEISEKINDFIHHNEVELWHYWMNQNLPKWAVITGVKKVELLAQIKNRLIKKIVQPQVIAFIEKMEIIESGRKLELVVRDDKVFENGKENINSAEKRELIISKTVLLLLEKNILKISTKNKLFSQWSKEIILEFQKISKKYNLTFKSVFESFIYYVKKNPEQPQLYQQLIQVKSSSVFKNVELKEKEFQQKRMLDYVLQKGSLPWWDENYKWEDFNAGFLSLWNTTTGKQQLIKQLLKRNKEINIQTILNEENLYNVWVELDKSPDKTFSILTREIHRLFNQQMLPVGTITIRQYEEFNTTFFQLFVLRSSSSKKVDQVLGFLKKWIETIDEQEKRNSLNLLINMLKQIDVLDGSTESIIIRKEIEKWVKELTHVSISKRINIDFTNVNSVSEFLRSHPLAYQWKDQPLITQLETIKQVSTAELGTILSNTVLRDSLIEELDDKQLFYFVQLNLNTNQQQFLTESIAVISAGSSFISSRELNILKRQYFKLILQKIGSGGFSAWSIKNWTYLLMKCSENVLGKSKSREVFMKTSNKLFAKKGDQYNKGMQLLDQIHTVIISEEEVQVKKQEEEKDYRRLGEERVREFLDPIFIKNAGLILLSPYLGMLFERCGLMQQSEFIDDESRFKAVHLLEYAATGKTGKEEYELVINKLLCGMSITDPVERNVELSDNDKEIVNGLLTAITQQWKPLNGTSIEGLQESFIQRDGKLEEEEEQYFLKVEQKAFDMLLDQVPWNIGTIKLSWMKKILIIEWR